jgi:hypothetical protein
MTIENGAEQAANDIALPDDQTEEAMEAPAEIEVEYEGKTYCVPPELKDALLRQSDYTRKTQEVAQARKALEAERQAHHHGAHLTRAHLQDAARVVALNDQLAHFEKIDWRTLEGQDRGRAQALWRQREQIKDLRDRAARAWTEKEQEHASHSQRATAKRLDEVTTHLPRLIAEWSPELDVKLAQFGTDHGLSREEMAMATLQNPAFVKLLHKAHQFHEADMKKQTQQTFEAAQAARPVTRVGGGGGTASRRTTDSSGDALSTDEWVKRERDRLRKR